MKMEITVTIEQTFDGAIVKVTTPQCDWIKQHPTSEDAIAEAVRLGLVTKRIADGFFNPGGSHSQGIKPDVPRCTHQ